MKVLILAPQPFFQERGTPIAVKLLSECLGKIDGIEPHLLTYQEGDDVSIKGVTHHRSKAPSFLYGVKPGFSWKKIILDVYFLISIISLIRNFKPDLLHAVEESGYMALFLKLIYRTPYVFDLDSKIIEQATLKFKLLSLFSPLTTLLDKYSINNAEAVLAVCPALVTHAEKYSPKLTELLPDISLLEESNETTSIRQVLGLASEEIILYVGNFEYYQGLDLFIDSMVELIKLRPDVHAVLVGGTQETIAKMRTKSDTLNISHRVHFPGPRPSRELKSLLEEANVVVSPRTHGENTPMKIYSYLDSGTPLVATNLVTHTQVITSSHAYLADPTPCDFAEKLHQALSNTSESKEKALNARKLVSEKYSKDAFNKKITRLYLELMKK